MNRTITFDADSRAKARAEESVITIGGREFRPRKKTADVMRDLLALDPPEDATPDQQVGAFVPQIAILLADTTGDSPPVEFLAEHLDFEDAGELLGELLGAGSAEGKP